MDKSQMPKVVLLAGGLGTRISEESDFRPKPMIEVGGVPILLHIMEHYARHGMTDFVICSGHKGDQIRQYFLDFPLRTSDFTVNLGTGRVRIDKSSAHNWNVSVVDTGESTMTGGRLRKVANLLGETFFMTYGDGLAAVDLSRQLAFHQDHGKLGTVMAVRPPGRFGVLRASEDGAVTNFAEKPIDEVGWVSGGFFVLNRAVIDLIDGDDTSWEQEPMKRLAESGQLRAFFHEGFWQPVDTLNDKRTLEKLWRERSGPWAR